MKRRLLILLLLSIPWQAFAFLTVQLNLEQLTILAERVFVGRCVDLREGRDRNGRPVQYVTFQVDETLKGPEADQVTFKQILLKTDEAEGRFTATTSFSQLPSYQVGEEAVVFLSEPSEIGFTAPVGLSQGKFVIETDAAGKRWVKNGLGNRGLFRGLRSSPRVKSLPLSSSQKAQLKGDRRTISYEDLVSWVGKLK